MKQATLKGRQWRYGITVWAFMVAGLIGRRKAGSRDPCDPPPRKRKRGEDAAGSAETASMSSVAAAVATMLEEDGASDAGSEATACTMSGGEEEGEREPVAEPDATADEWAEAFGTMESHEAVLDVVCRGAKLMARMCLDNEYERTEWTDEQINELSVEARDFVCTFVRVLFGAVHTSKMHRLAFHLADELILRGNLSEADTSVNEMLMKLCKAMYARTNKHVTTFKVQLLRAQQTLERIIAEDEDRKNLAEAAMGEETKVFEPCDEQARGEVEEPAGLSHEGGEMGALLGRADEDEVEVEGGMDWEGGEPAGPQRAPDGGQARRKRVRVRGRRVQVGDVAGLHGGRLQALPELLELHSTQYITVRNSAVFNAKFEWKAEPTVKEQKQEVRAAAMLWSAPWYDHVRWYDDDGAPCYGLVRLVLCAKTGTSYHAVVVQRLVESPARPNCILTKSGCERLQWKMDDHTGFPALEVLLLRKVQRLEHIVPDFEDLCERHGLLATPGNIVETPDERTMQRYFTNVWYPWTGGLSYELSR